MKTNYTHIQSSQELQNYIKTYLIRSDGNTNAAFMKTDKWKLSNEKKIIDELTDFIETDSVLVKLKYLIGELEFPRCKHCGKVIYKIRNISSIKTYCSKKCAASYNKEKRNITNNRKLENSIKTYPKFEKAVDEKELIKILNKRGRYAQLIPYLIKHKIYYNVLYHKVYEDDSLKEIIFRIINKMKKRPTCYCGRTINFGTGMYYRVCSNSCNQILQGANGDTEKAMKYSISGFEEYSRNVRNLTEKQPVHLLENIEKRGKINKVGSYQLDHIIPVRYGYDNGIMPWVIANINNLRMIPSKENTSKGAKYLKDILSIEELFNLIDKGNNT